MTGWMVVLPDDPARPNIFQLNDPDKGQLHTTNRVTAVFFFLHLNSDNHNSCHFTGNVYKFQTGSRFSAIIWHKNLEEACRSSRPQVCSARTFICLNHGSVLVGLNNSFYLKRHVINGPQSSNHTETVL